MTGGADEPEYGPVPGRLIPRGNLEPSTLATLIREDFIAAWDSMARCNRMPHTGANFMFARQALAYFELACRTASSWDTDVYLEAFALRLAERDRRYFSELPGTVALPSAPTFRMPTLPAGPPADRQLISAIFDLGRNGLAHLYQQIPATLADDRRWTLTFTGVEKGMSFEAAGDTERRAANLAYSDQDNGTVRLIVCPDVLMSDLIWAARLAGIFNQHLTLDYLRRPRGRAGHYAFDSAALTSALDAAGHARLR